MNYYRGRTTSTQLPVQRDETAENAPNLEGELQHCSEVVSQALYARAIVHLQNNDRENALSDLTAAVTADKANDDAADLLAALVNKDEQHLNSHTDPTHQPLGALRVIETGYTAAALMEHGTEVDDSLYHFTDNDKGKYYAIREAFRCGYCDPTSEKYYDSDDRWPPHTDWKYAVVYRTFTIRQELMRVAVNFDSKYYWPHVPSRVTAPLAHCRPGLPKGKWHYAFQWLEKDQEIPQPEPFECLPRLESLIEKLVILEQPVLVAVAEASGQSLHGVSDQLAADLTNDGESRLLRSTWRERRTIDSGFAQSLECRCHEFLDEVRRNAECFLDQEAIEPQHHEQLLQDAEIFACEFLREQLTPTECAIPVTT